MTKVVNGRKLFVLLWLAGFVCGVFVERQSAFSGCEVQATEMTAFQSERDEEKDTPVLPMVFYDDMGRKVVVRRDGVLQLSENLSMEISLENWKEGQKGMVEIRVSYEDGSEERNAVCIQRKALHNEEK